MSEIIAFDKEELREQMEEHGLDNLAEVLNSAYSSGSVWTTEYILPNSTGELVFWQEIKEIDGKLKTSNIKEYEIEYTPEGKPYFEPTGNHSSRRYFENYIRLNYGRLVE